MSWAHYLLQVNIYLVVFFCFYKLLLDKETYFVLNRIYLIASGVLSLAIPFLRLEWLAKAPATQQMYIKVDQLNIFVSQVAVDPNAEKFNWGSLIVSIYLIGILFFIGRFIFQLIAVRKMFHTDNNGVAFSFLNKKVIANNVPEPATINLHEEIHIKQKHTIDVLFFELLAVFTWFNPIIYAYKYTVKNIHEFLADEAAANFQGDKETYSLLLLSQAFGARPSDLTNGFFTKSLIKKRIFMLHKQRSKKTAILKYGLFVPLFSLTLILSSATIRKNDELIAVADKIPLNNIRNVVSEAIEAPLRIVDVELLPDKTTTSQKTVVTKENKTLLTNNKAWLSFYNFLGNKIKYPVAAINNNKQGNARINFSVHDGKIENAWINGDLGHDADQEVKQTVLSFDKPIATVDGKYSLVASFKLGDEESKVEAETIDPQKGYTELPKISVVGYATQNDTDENPADNTIYSFVSMENPPTYPGGMNKFYSFLSNAIKYPTMASESNIQGTVFVSFTVEKDGSLTDIKVDRKLGYGTDEEAVRVLKMSKRWNPGMQNGRLVRVKYNIPIKFTMPATAIAKLKGISINANGTQPMVIIDGKKQDMLVLSDVKAETVERIEVLKSPESTALYGDQGKNGIILVTTKKPISLTVK